MEGFEMGGHSGGGGRTGRGGGTSIATPEVSPGVQELIKTWPGSTTPSPEKLQQVLDFANTQKTFGNRFIDKAEEQFGVSVGIADHVAKYVKEKRSRGITREEKQMTAREKQAQRILTAVKNKKVKW